MYWEFKAIDDEDRNDDVVEYLKTDKNATIDALLSYFVKYFNGHMGDEESRALWVIMEPVSQNLIAKYEDYGTLGGVVTLQMLRDILNDDYKLPYYITISEMNFLELPLIIIN